MRRVLTPDQMRRADESAIQGGIPAEVLMDRAGRAVARAAVRVAGGRYGKRALVVCGKGNNGGDGFVAARLLARSGFAVTCMTTFPAAEATGAAGHHLDLMRWAGVQPRAFDATAVTTVERRRSDVVIDAIFGTGFRGVAEGTDVEAIALINGSGAPVVAVDIPSGVDGATGAVVGQAVRAAVTVSLAAAKVGTVLLPGRAHAGDIEIADIGVDPDLSDMEPGAYIGLVDHDDVTVQPWRRPPGTHKLSSGAVAILAGSDDIVGAALLTARGAVRAGAGYVILGSTGPVVDAAAVAAPEIVSHVLTRDDTLGPDALDAFKPALERAGVVAIGPGLHRDPPQAELVRRVLAEIDVPVVVDADALNALDGDLSAVAARTAATILTPHAGELARLLTISASDVEVDRVRAAVRASRAAGYAVVVCKGEPTLVAGDSGAQVLVVDSGGAELATAGTGDVLTGVMAARLAIVPDAMAAAVGAAYVHGRAGRLAAAAQGSLGIAAGDVAESLPAAMSELAAGAPAR